MWNSTTDMHQSPVTSFHQLWTRANRVSPCRTIHWRHLNLFWSEIWAHLLQVVLRETHICGWSSRSDRAATSRRHFSMSIVCQKMQCVQYTTSYRGHLKSKVTIISTKMDMFNKVVIHYLGGNQTIIARKSIISSKLQQAPQWAEWLQWKIVQTCTLTAV